MEQIIVTIISSVCMLLGTIITVIVSNNKLKTELELKQKFQQEQIDAMKKDIKEHNDYAKRMPVIETELTFIRQMIEEIKNK